MQCNNAETTYGMCRCCSQVGNHLDFLKEHHFEGGREIFYDIFVKCFDYFLSTNKKFSTLICSQCVTRLRDAATFRNMVEETERQLLSTLSNGNDKQTLFVVVPSAELQETSTLDGDLDIKSETEDRDDFDNDDNCGIQSEQSDLVDGETELLNRFRPGSLRQLPSRDRLRGHCPLYVKYLDKLRGKRITPSNIAKLLQNPNRTRKKTKTDLFVTEKLANTINACTLLENSNATAFKTKTKAGYPCFYCRNIFYDIENLRAHQNNHQKSTLFKLLSKYTADSLVVYVDITDLICEICHQNMANLNELKTHLIQVHKKNYYTDFEDRLVPFKLKGNSDFKCQVCGFNFETFGAIERHMNVHYRNRICEQCGAGFVTMHRLKIHNYSVHRRGSFPCEICKKIYVSYNKYRIHFDVVHRLERKNKCPKCPEKFIDYFTKQKHLVEKHGASPIRYKCNVCDKSFTRRFSLVGHMKRRHLDQKEVKCTHCSYMCYTKWELKVHMTKHGAEKLFECELCKKTYTRQRALKEHLKIHERQEH